MPVDSKVWDVLMGKTIGDIGKIVDDVVTTEEEKATITLKLIQTLGKTMVEMQDVNTERLRIDMQSDSKFTKLIRPLVMAWIVIFMTILAITDGNLGFFNIADEWVEMFKSWGSMVFMFYFGSRGVEKVMDIVEKQKTMREDRRLAREERSDARIERMKNRSEMRERRRERKREERQAKKEGEN